MTRGQRTAHRIIWLIVVSVGAILIFGAILVRPPTVQPAAPVRTPEAAP